MPINEIKISVIDKSTTKELCRIRKYLQWSVLSGINLKYKQQQNFGHICTVEEFPRVTIVLIVLHDFNSIC